MGCIVESVTGYGQLRNHAVESVSVLYTPGQHWQQHCPSLLPSLIGIHRLVPAAAAAALGEAEWWYNLVKGRGCSFREDSRNERAMRGRERERERERGRERDHRSRERGGEREPVAWGCHAFSIIASPPYPNHLTESLTCWPVARCSTSCFVACICCSTSRRRVHLVQPLSTDMCDPTLSQPHS